MPKYSEKLMTRNRMFLGLDSDDTSLDDEINLLTPKLLLDNCLKWEGIIGYTDLIISLVTELDFDV